MKSIGPSPARRLEMAFRMVTARNPAQKELAVLQDLARKQEARYANDVAAARELLTVGERKPDPRIQPAELAAWTNVVTVLLNTDEAITKE